MNFWHFYIKAITLHLQKGRIVRLKCHVFPITNNMDIWDLFFGAGPAVTKIMEPGFMPKDEDFLELTAEQYNIFYEQDAEV